MNDHETGHDDDRPQRGLLQTVRVGSCVLRKRLGRGWWGTLTARLRLKLWGARVGRGLRVFGHLRLHSEGRLEIGADVRINSGPANYVGGDRRTALWVGRRGHLQIADGCAISNSTVVCMSEVTILAETFVGGGCEIYDTDFHHIDATARIARRGEVSNGPIRIGPKAFVGAWCIILKNVTIGEGAIIAAGSVVTKSVPPYELWAGVPARFIRKLERCVEGPVEARGGPA